MRVALVLVGTDSYDGFCRRKLKAIVKFQLKRFNRCDDSDQFIY
jgi:hypothetical protein